MTTVSVVVPTRNRDHLLREALESIRRLEGPDLVLQIIVANNGSSPDTARIAEEFGATYVKEWKSGASAARNACLRLAEGDYIAFLDDDDLWTESHLRPHVKLLEQRRDLGAVVGQARNVDAESSMMSAPWPKKLPASGDLVASFFSIQPQIGATVIRASALEHVGFFDEALVGDEDWDWHLRLATSQKVGFVPVPSVLFRQRITSGDDELRWIRLSFMRQVFFMNLRRIGLFKVSPLLLLRSYLRYKSEYTFYFGESVKQHSAAGRLDLARRAVGFMLKTSVLQSTRFMLTDAALRSAVLKA